MRVARDRSSRIKVGAPAPGQQLIREGTEVERIECTILLLAAQEYAFHKLR